jgi:uncharacterized SAM-binding protein YcdF (DUF218 family)
MSRARARATGRRTHLVGFTLLAAVGGAVLARDLPAERLMAADALAPSDAIVVMAGDPGYERTTTAAALMRAKLAPTLILTGGEPGPGDSAESLRAQALVLGVRAESIRIENTSHSTREAVQALAPILAAMGARTVTVVTSPYHQRRATAAARRAWPGVEVRSHSASPSFWTAQGWWRSFRGIRVVGDESVKLLYYRLRGWI